MELEESAKEILAHLRGEIKLPTRRIVLPDNVDVRRTLQEWEQGPRKPDATTRAYLAVIEKNRKAVLDALAS